MKEFFKNDKGHYCMWRLKGFATLFAGLVFSGYLVFTESPMMAITVFGAFTGTGGLEQWSVKREERKEKEIESTERIETKKATDK